MIGSLVQIRDDTDPVQSDTTLLVASLMALGIPKAGKDLLHLACEPARGGQRWQAFWSLASESPCKRFKTRTLVKAWDDPNWLLANPTHPLAILRSGLSFKRAFSYTPKFTKAELAHIETPDTWLEAAIFNLIFILRNLPSAGEVTRGVIRFGSDHCVMVPKHLQESQKSRLIKYAETTDPTKRAKLRAA